MSQYMKPFESKLLLWTSLRNKISSRLKQTKNQTKTDKKKKVIVTDGERKYTLK